MRTRPLTEVGRPATARLVLAVGGDVASILTACLLLGSFGFMLLSTSRQRHEPLPPMTARATSTPVDMVTTTSRATLNNGHPTVALVEFADYQCPYCERFESETVQRIRSEFVDTGRVAYVFRHFPLDTIHTNARHASEIAECAARQNQFWPVHSYLFSVKGLTDDATVFGGGALAGIDEHLLQNCVERGGGRDGVQTDATEGRRLGVKGTPTIFIGPIAADGTIRLRRRIVGAVSYDALRQAIEAALNQP